MQIFLFGALAISLVAVVFALQNIGPVTVTFLSFQFEGSLALVLFVALVSGALISFLASVPTMVKGRWTARDLHRQIAVLEAELAGLRRPRPAPETPAARPMMAPGPGAPRADRPSHSAGPPLEPKA